MPLRAPYYSNALHERAKAHLLTGPDATVTLFLESGEPFLFRAFVPSPAGTIEGYDSRNPALAALYSIAPDVVVAMELGQDGAFDGGLGVSPEEESLHQRREALFAELRQAATIMDGDLIGEALAGLDRLDVEAKPLFARNAALRGGDTPAIGTETPELATLASAKPAVAEQRRPARPRRS